MISERTRKISYIFFIIVLVFVLGLAQGQVDELRSQFRQKETLLYLPSGNFIKMASLGFDEVVADFLYIKGVLYFGGHFLTDKEYLWLYHLLDIATSLSPKFKDIYEFGAIVLSFEVGQVDNSILLLEKAMKNNPNYWRFPFYLGFNYFYFKQDYTRAAHFMKQASLLPGRPAYLPKLVSRLYAEAKQPEFAISFLERILENTQDERLKKEIGRRIKYLIVESHFNTLEKAILEYKERFQKSPQGLDDLVEAGLIKNIPQEPFGGRYLLKEGEVSSSTRPKKLKVYKKGVNYD